MKQHISLFGLTAIILFAFPVVTQAYSTSEQTVKRLTPLTAMYTITYTFGHGSRDMYLPAATEIDVDLGESDDRLGYSVYSPSDSSTDVRTAAMIFSNADWEDGFYHIPAGKTATFSFIALVRTEEGSLPGDYGVKVNNLPFKFVTEGKTSQQGLNKFELEKYQTAAVELNPQDN